MSTKRQLYFLTFALLFAVVMLLGPMRVDSQSIQEGACSPGSFSYQGQLKKDGSLVNGIYDFQIKLYDAVSGGTQLGETCLLNNVAVTDGVFTVQLDFGPGVFDGYGRWLEIRVKPSAADNYTVLMPRQELTPTPYASHAFSIADGAVTTAKLADSTIADLEDMIEAKINERLADLQGQVEALEAENAALQALLTGVTRVDVDGSDTLSFNGMNVQVNKGDGSAIMHLLSNGDFGFTGTLFGGNIPAELITGTLAPHRIPPLDASIITSGVLNQHRIDGSKITSINGNNITSGTISPHRLGSGWANSNTFLRGDGRWAEIPGTADLTMTEDE